MLLYEINKKHFKNEMSIDISKYRFSIDINNLNIRKF